MSATDPSSGKGVSAPGDTSHEQPSVRELVLGALPENDWRTLLDGGTPSHEQATSLGPLCDALTFCGREVLVQQYTPAVWRSQVAWDTCWHERDYDVLGEQLRADWPDTPRTDYTTVRLTWGQIRTWVREEIAGKRKEARFCSMRCRQASSRHALRAPKVPR